GKNNNDQDTHHAAEGHERNGRGGRAQSDDARGRSAAELWNCLSGSEPGPGFDGLGEHGFARRALSRAGEGAARARGNPAEALRALGAERRAGKDIFRWNAAAAGNCTRLFAYAKDFIFGRADAGSRSAKPQPVVDTREAAE